MLLGIIPARGGSQRIKNKNISNFCGNPLITYSLVAAQDSGIFDEIHVSTDSPDIARVAKEAGFPVLFMRDPTLADSHTPLVPVLQWVLSEYQKMGKTFSEVCCLMPTAPLVNGDDLRSAVDIFRRQDGTLPLIAVSGFPVPIEWAMDIDPDGIAIPRSPEKLSIRSQDLKKCYYDNGSFTFFTSRHLLTPDGLSDPRMIAYCMPKSRSVDIDDPEDLELAEILYLGNRARNLSRLCNK